MKRRLKTHTSLTLILVILASFLFSNQVLAYDSTHDCTDCAYHLMSASNYTWEKEVVVEVQNESETFTYPRNPNYRYTFVWFTPSQSRAVCYNCGASAMGTVTRKSQWGCDDIQCPLAWGAGLNNDLFSTWYHYMRERCTSCGYKSEEWVDRISYTAYCSNDDNPALGEWEVRLEYVPSAGYNPHQSLRWWLYREQL